MWLDAMGASVTGYALEPPTKPSLFEQAKCWRIGSLDFTRTFATFNRLKTAIAEYTPDVDCSFGCTICPSVAAMTIPSKLILPTSMGGPFISWRPLRQLERPCVVVNVTSDKCYASQEWVWGYRGKAIPWVAGTPNSNSKGCAELVTNALPRLLLSSRNL